MLAVTATSFCLLAVNSGCTARVRQGVQQVPYCMARLSSELLRAVTDALTLFSHALAMGGTRARDKAKKAKGLLLDSAAVSSFSPFPFPFLFDFLTFLSFQLPSIFPSLS
jgi:hypothetical protein